MIQANEVMARANELYREKKGVEHSMPSEQIHVLCIALCESFNKELDERIESVICSITCRGTVDLVMGGPSQRRNARERR